MTNPYVGELRIFAGNFAPQGWLMCDGQVVSISDYDTLFNLLGTTYGGDGQSTFGIPDLRGRVPVHQGSGPGQNYVMGQTGGLETVTLTSPQMAQHTHSLVSTSTPATLPKPSNQTIFADMGPPGANLNAYAAYAGTSQVTLAGASVSVAGGNQSHENRQPYLGVNFIISLYGVYPSQN